jgi:GTP-binding protein
MGLTELMQTALADEPEEDPTPASSEAPDSTRVAIVGRPNVGKSTLVNALIGERRMVASEQPGTTRDAIEVEFEFDGSRFTLIDTAGIRRKGLVFEAVEKFSVIKTLQAVEECNVATLLLDASGEIAEQDAHIAGYILERGRALVLAVNKWDAVREEQRERIKREMRRKLHFLDWASLHFISALRGTGLQGLMRSVVAAEQAAFCRLPTPRLTRALRAAVERQEPPRAGNLRPKLRYAHQGGSNPPIIVIHGNSLRHVPDSYRRYLEGWFREQFGLRGTPLRIEFRSGLNPYASQRAGKGSSFPVD